jgi:uncharacterized lipoprotein YddW (UPF0748 family)
MITAAIAVVFVILRNPFPQGEETNEPYPGVGVEIGQSGAGVSGNGEDGQPGTGVSGNNEPGQPGTGTPGINETGQSGTDIPNNSETVTSPETLIVWRDILPYISAQLTDAEELTALIDYALNRYRLAQVEGANIRTGRHTAADMLAFFNAIQTAQKVFEENTTPREENTTPRDEATTPREAIINLQHAIDDFRRVIIDPDNRYRPFLHEMAIGEDIPQKYHLRGAWIATVVNIDWPSAEARGTTPAHVDLQKYELRQRFDEMAALGFNAVIFQISPTGDAFFRSAVSPWSVWLTGETNFAGELLDSGGVEFDPLAYAIQLARERTMEVHAWFNPYRVTHTVNNYRNIILSSTGEYVTSLTQIRDEWSQIPGTAFYLFGDYIKLGENRYVVDPAAPGVREWITRRVMEVVENYDIDAVHFDDYFYPSDFPITDTYARYNVSGHADTVAGRADFRRQQTEHMIRDVGTAIRATAPWVKFGISPGGVWKSAPQGNTGLDGGGFDAGTGSPSTTTWSNYHSSFADTRRWVIENYIDYLTPQIYWEWTHPSAPYGYIADWWARLFRDYGRDGHLRNSRSEYTHAQLFIGVGLYRMDNQYASTPVTIPQKWRNMPGYENEGQRTFLRQEAYNLGNSDIHGSMIFSQNHMRPGRGQGMGETLSTQRETLWRYPALVPPMPHLNGFTPSRPGNVIIGEYFISWKNTETNPNPLVTPRYFVVYRSHNERINLNDPGNIFAIVPAVSGNLDYTLAIPEGTGGYYYVVTAVNRLHDESLPG